MGNTATHGLVRWAAALVAVVVVACACSSPRIHRLTDFDYLPKPPHAPMDLYIGKLKRPHEAIAIMDSERYAAKDDSAKRMMLEDLKKHARRLGADAVQDVRLLAVKIRGMVPDRRVPLPGAIAPSYYRLYFLRGQAIKLVEELPPDVVARADEPVEDEVGGYDIRRPAIADEEEEAVPATPERLREPSISFDEGE